MSNGVVSWSFSTKVVVAATCTYQSVGMQRVQNKLGHFHCKYVIVLCDDYCTIKLYKNLVLEGRIKHIDVRFHLLRDLTKDVIFELKFGSDNAPAFAFRS